MLARSCGEGQNYRALILTVQSSIVACAGSWTSVSSAEAATSKFSDTDFCNGPRTTLIVILKNAGAVRMCDARYRRGGPPTWI